MVLHTNVHPLNEDHCKNILPFEKIKISIEKSQKINIEKTHCVSLEMKQEKGC
jgi:hypothetical protein